jgi:hypothetical protein
LQNLAFYLFVQKQRHSVIGQIYGKLCKDSAAFEQSIIFTSAVFQTKLQIRITNPWGKPAREVLKKLIPVLISEEKNTVIGALEPQAAAGDILAMEKAYDGRQNILLVLVDDMHTPRRFH